MPRARTRSGARRRVPSDVAPLGLSQTGPASDERPRPIAFLRGAAAMQDGGAAGGPTSKSKRIASNAATCGALRRGRASQNPTLATAPRGAPLPREEGATLLVVGRGDEARLAAPHRRIQDIELDVGGQRPERRRRSFVRRAAHECDERGVRYLQEILPSARGEPACSCASFARRGAIARRVDSGDGLQHQVSVARLRQVDRLPERNVFASRWSVRRSSSNRRHHDV